LIELYCYSVDPAEQTVYEEHFANDFYNENAPESFPHISFDNENLHYKDIGRATAKERTQV
jgi:hypothetical protein